MFKIDLKKGFPLLARAPIVEAVIEVCARAQVPWEESAISERLKPMLPEYPAVQSNRKFQHELKLAIDQSPEQTVQDLGWQGLRCESADKRHIAQFNRDGFVFSRLAPYESWYQFQRESLRLWQIHRELAQPTEAQRLGLRFINRIEIPPEGRLEDYLVAAPKTPRNMEIPFSSFLHHNTLTVPGYLYAINIIQTVQQPQGPEAVGLILDIDVLTTQPVDLDKDVFEQHLAEMRWLKNKVFFGSITKDTWETFK